MPCTEELKQYTAAVERIYREEICYRECMGADCEFRKSEKNCGKARDEV